MTTAHFIAAVFSLAAIALSGAVIFCTIRTACLRAGRAAFARGELPGEDWDRWARRGYQEAADEEAMWEKLRRQWGPLADQDRRIRDSALRQLRKDGLI